MTISQKKKILRKITSIERDIDKLKSVRLELISSGYASATMSSGGGSRSYTRLDVDKVTNTIAQLQAELGNLRKLLNGTALGAPTQIQTVYW